MRDRRALDVVGVVQGVGFRPHVHALASQLELGGFVRNEAGRVRIEVEGLPAAIDELERRLKAEAPVLARIDHINAWPQALRGERAFRIAPSVDAERANVYVAPDAAPCAECLAEALDPSSRRHGYPFSSCTACGPRLTIVERAPYDRANTSMAAFEMCAECRAEYEDPSDRRFHAEPIACPACGPSLSVPLAEAVAALRAGKIVALKGVGGFHLSCDARDAAAVQRLRARKGRDEKPFAVMVGSLEAARALCEVGDQDAATLASWQRPIVLLPARVELAGIAPGLSSLGVMLPSSLLHALLFQALGDGVLVMTSGNASDEPICFEDDEARDRLGEIADLIVGHDRPIRTRCDDSIVRGGLMLRRARGFAPVPFSLPVPLAKPTLAVGGMLKSTFALGDGTRALASHHLGDLQHHEAFVAFERSIAQYQQVFRVRPERVVADLHPDYPSAVWARALGLELMLVQHHRAHVASCLLEHGVTGPVTAVAFDGAGYGDDGSIWGGEIFSGDERVWHLPQVPMPGGDRAAREPWRMAAMHLRAAGLPVEPRAHALVALAERRVNSPMTSSAGRLFDAAAWLCGVGENQTFEGQAAMRLEALAASVSDAGHYPTEAIIASLHADRSEAAVRARRFHSTLAHLIAERCAALPHERVALTGGCFQNVLLSSETAALLRARGLQPLLHRAVPCNDGGLCLGQLYVAAARDGGA